MLPFYYRSLVISSRLQFVLETWQAFILQISTEMGLCKCPKKKVTTLFCFEHKVNVCEHCLVSNHQRCIVQSYLKWLEDSDYDDTCQLCKEKLSDEAHGPCVRLLCYDVFHWTCLNRYALQLPANTAPAGYTCPQCRSAIFPDNNVASPIANSLRELLCKVNWARAGLGMPLVEEPSEPSVRVQQNPVPAPVAHSTPAAPSVVNNVPHTVVSVNDVPPYSRSEKGAGDLFTEPRKLFDSTREDQLLNMSQDHDNDKYKRRPALQWLLRWFKSRTSSRTVRDPNARLKRLLVVIILTFFAFVTFILIMQKLGRSATDDDPFLDPMANPNIRVNER